MTPEKQIIAIAKACGWTKVEQNNFKFLKISSLLGHGFVGENPNKDYNHSQLGLDVVPRYLSDLNAMHEAEKVLTPGQHTKYFQHVHLLAGADVYKGSMNWCIIHVPAAIRAEAFLKTLGLWEE